MKKLLLLSLMLVSSAWASVVTVTVPHPPGGAPDVWARIVSKYLAQELDHDFVVVNRPAADGRIAVDNVLQQPANGRNIIVVSTGPFLFNKILFKKLNYDYTDFDTIVPLAQVPIALVVSNRLGVNNLKEFITLARTKSLNCAGSSASSVFIGRYMMQEIKSKEVQFVPFKGSADMNVQLAAGNIDCGFDTTLATLPLHQDGKFKIIATSTQTQILPNTGLFKSAVPNLVFYNWYGIGLRINSPGSDQVFKALRKINKNPEFQSVVVKAGLEIVDPPEHGTQWLHQEYLRFDAIRESLKIPKE